MSQYREDLAYSKFLSGDGEAPLFPGEDGAALAKEKTIAVIRRTLANNKVSLKRPGPKGVGVVERFHGHCLRVSGAQLMCRLRVPVSTIMLLGRWGSRSIERYVQDAELEVFDIAEAAENSARQAQTEPVSLQKLQHVQAQHAQQHVDTTGLVERLDNLAAQVETLQQRPPFIVGRKVHKRDDDEATKLPRRDVAVGNMAVRASSEFGSQKMSFAGAASCKRQMDKQSPSRCPSRLARRRILTRPGPGHRLVPVMRAGDVRYAL